MYAWNTWSRPGYCVPAAVAVHFFGMLGCRIFSALQTAVVAYLAYRIAARLCPPPRETGWAGRLQALAVPHGHSPMRVVDESGVLKGSGNPADGRTLHAEHDRQKLMAQRGVLLVHAVVCHQQPPGAALLHMMQHVTRR